MLVKDNTRINFHLVGPATTLADKAIEEARAAEQAESKEVEKLATNVATLRQNEIDPISGNADMQLAQQELSRLIAEKEKAESDQRNAESFATAERGGLTKAPGNSGHPGAGPKYRAAREDADNAKNYAEQVSRALEAARSRVDALRDKFASVDEQVKQKAQDQLPGFEASLNAENAKLATLRGQLVTLVEGRNATIRKAVESAPDFVPLNSGFLARISALESIAHDNPRVMIVMILLEIVSFCLEVAAILATMAGGMSTYSALIARDAYTRLVKIADEMATDLEKSSHKAPEPEILPPEAPADDQLRNASEEASTDPFEKAAAAAGQSPKRRRGRPRKSSPDTNGSKAPTGEKGKRGNQPGQGQYKVADLPGNVAIFK